MSSGEAVMFGSRVSWLSWFRAYAECNPYNIVGNQESLPGLFVMVFVLRDKTAYIISDDEKRIEW